MKNQIEVRASSVFEKHGFRRDCF